MSLPSSAANPPAAQKPGPNVYTVMLIVSFLSIVTACVLLYMELNRFGNYPWWQTGAGGS